MKSVITATALAALLLAPVSAISREKAPAPTITADRVKAEEVLLAGPGLRGRGSATPDEAIAAGYVASLFRDFGLRTPPGMDGYLQTAPLVRRAVAGAPTVTVDGRTVTGATLLMTSGGKTGGKVAIMSDPKGEVPKADVILYAGPADAFMSLPYRLRGTGVSLLLLAESDATRELLDKIGGKPTLPTTFADDGVQSGMQRRRRLTILALPADTIAAIKPGSDVQVDVPVVTTPASTTNAIGYLPGTDPDAGVILLSAHLDHLGVRPDGVVMPGANDDASGTVAVIELARAFARMKPMKRGILFVAYGSEEIGGLGSTWFGEHPPVPLDRIVANIEFEMIGAQDPKLPKGALMMTGSERSNLFDMLKAHGALVAADPYPDQHFFERSDNYSLALKGIVAHTFSGWAVVPTYHQPTDTVENIDIDYMTAAIRSLVAPVRLLAQGAFRPEWKDGGRPKR